MKNHCQRKKKCLCRLLVALFTIIVVCIIFCVTLVMLKNQKPKEEKQLMPDLSGPIIEEIIASLIDVPGKNFKASKYEVTQAQWNYIMGDNTSKYVGDNLPVTNVSYEDCLDFINILNHSSIVKERGLIFKLPNESEWRYACKAGGLGDFGNVSQNQEGNISDVAWYIYNSNNQPHQVGQKTPNAWGIYDMHGNVWEWTTTKKGEQYLLYGGAYNLNDYRCTVTSTIFNYANYRHQLLGFRLFATEK